MTLFPAGICKTATAVMQQLVAASCLHAADGPAKCALSSKPCWNDRETAVHGSDAQTAMHLLQSKTYGSGCKKGICGA